MPPELGTAIEKLGFGTIWIGGSPRADLRIAEKLLDATEHITVATGIVNIWSSPAAEVAESYHRLEAAHPGRFLLGVGVGHPEATGDYTKPYASLVSYLDELDAAQVPEARRVLAALGPKVLKLSAARAAGAHPYLTTPEHTPKLAKSSALRRSWPPSTRLSWKPIRRRPEQSVVPPSPTRICICATTRAISSASVLRPKSWPTRGTIASSTPWLRGVPRSPSRIDFGSMSRRVPITLRSKHFPPKVIRSRPTKHWPPNSSTDRATLDLDK